MACRKWPSIGEARRGPERRVLDGHTRLIREDLSKGVVNIGARQASAAGPGRQLGKAFQVEKRATGVAW